MPSERHTRPVPRERTFAELFPWRNIRRALMLVLLIVAIVMIKRSAGPWLARMGEMWGQPAGGQPAGGQPAGGQPAGGLTSHPTAPSGGGIHKIRVGSGFPPPIPATDAPAR